jgi:hypothetical protein
MGEGERRRPASPYAVIALGAMVAGLSFTAGIALQGDAGLWYLGWTVAAGFFVVGVITAGVRLGMRGALGGYGFPGSREG